MNVMLPGGAPRAGLFQKIGMAEWYSHPVNENIFVCMYVCLYMHIYFDLFSSWYLIYSLYCTAIACAGSSGYRSYGHW